MNFRFLEECSSKEEWMCAAYKQIETALEDAEYLYWKNPMECGRILRGVAEEICRIYNRHYEIGFRSDTAIQEFLCYTQDDTHNAMVSRFFSAVRKEQRDNLTKLRVLGDDCINGLKEEQTRELYDRMSVNAKHMMETMTETLKAMCIKINGQEGIEALRFDEGLLPEKKREEPEQEAKKQSVFSRFFGKK